MYTKELEELIESVIADGVLTDTERQVLIARANKCGEDPNEVLVYTEGLIAKMKAKGKTGPAQSVNQKYGVILKCPACGEPINKSMGKCPACGHLFTGVESNASIAKLSEQLSKTMPWSKISVIKHFPIPNTKEELLDFIIALKEKANSDDFFHETYRIKCEECIEKAKLSFSNDRDFIKVFSDYEVQKAKKKKKNLIITICAAAVLVFIIALPIIIESNSEDEIDKIHQVSDSLSHAIDNLPSPDENNYRECVNQIQRITWPVVDTYKDSDKEAQIKLIQSFIAKKNAYIGLINNLGLANPIPFDIIGNYIVDGNSNGLDNNIEEGYSDNEKDLENDSI
jgi:hypothetical protein